MRWVGAAVLAGSFVVLTIAGIHYARIGGAAWIGAAMMWTVAYLLVFLVGDVVEDFRRNRADRR